MAFPFINAILQFFDNSGNVLSGGLLYTYAPGTTTPKTTYTDENLSVPNANPIVLDSAGRCVIFLADGQEYKFVLQTSAGVVIKTVDEVKSPSALTQSAIAQLLYPTTAAETGAGVTPVDFSVDPRTRSVLRYGTNTTPGTTDMTAAFIACRAVNSGSWYAPAGTYSIDNTALAYSGTAVYFEGRGDGMGATILKQRAATGNVISFATGGSYHSIVLSGFRIEGHASSSAGDGIFIHATLAQEVFALFLSDITISGMGGRGIGFDGQTFDTELARIWIDNCDGHQFELLGGNALKLTNCYALNVPTAAKAGFRIHRGTPEMTSCTGINSGDYWGIFGGTLADDGADENCNPILVDCNIEDFEVVGVWNKGGGMTPVNSAFIAPATGTVKAVLLNPANQSLVGALDSGTSFQTKGASWANSLPIHTSAAGQPFTLFPNNAATTVQWYLDTPGTTQTAASLSLSQISTDIFAVAATQLYALGPFRGAYARTTTLSGGTAAVTFSGLSLPDLANNAFMVVTSVAVNETIRVTGEATTGFTLTSSNGASTAAVKWFVIMLGA